MRIVLWTPALWVVLVGTASCQSRPSEPRPVQGGAGVPSVPPDTLPSDLYDPSNYVKDEVWMAATYLRDVLAVLFKPGTTQAQKQEAIDLVRGRVIGGRRFSNGDGYYYIRVPVDGRPGSLRPAVEALDRHPQVQIVMPEFVDVDLLPT